MRWIRPAAALAMGVLTACGGEDEAATGPTGPDPATAPATAPEGGEATPFDVTRLVLEKKLADLSDARAELAAELEALRARAPAGSGGRYAEGAREELARLEQRLAELDAEIRRTRLTLQNLPE